MFSEKDLEDYICENIEDFKNDLSDRVQDINIFLKDICDNIIFMKFKHFFNFQEVSYHRINEAKERIYKIEKLEGSGCENGRT